VKPNRERWYRQRITELERQVAGLTEQVNRLLEQVAKLSKNSSNVPSRRPAISSNPRSPHRPLRVTEKRAASRAMPNMSDRFLGRSKLIDPEVRIVEKGCRGFAAVERMVCDPANRIARASLSDYRISGTQIPEPGHRANRVCSLSDGGGKRRLGGSAAFGLDRLSKVGLSYVVHHHSNISEDVFGISLSTGHWSRSFRRPRRPWPGLMANSRPLWSPSPDWASTKRAIRKTKPISGPGVSGPTTSPCSISIRRGGHRSEGHSGRDVRRGHRVRLFFGLSGIYAGSKRDPSVLPGPSDPGDSVPGRASQCLCGPDGAKSFSDGCGSCFIPCIDVNN